MTTPLTLKEARIKVLYNALTRIKLTKDYNLSNPNVYTGTKTQKMAHNICVQAFNSIPNLINNFPLPIDLGSPVVNENSIRGIGYNIYNVTYYAGDMFVRLRAENHVKTGVRLTSVSVFDPMFNNVAYVSAININGSTPPTYYMLPATIGQLCHEISDRVSEHRAKMLADSDSYLLTFTNIGVP